MKNLILVLTLAALFCLTAPAGIQAQGTGGGFQAGEPLANQGGGGYTGGGARAVSVAEALKMPDDAWVSLTGKIDRQLGDEKYQFSDASGSITVEIDDEDWRGLSVGPNDTVLIRGEVDRELTHRKIDVKYIEKK